MLEALDAELLAFLKSLLFIFDSRGISLNEIDRLDGLEKEAMSRDREDKPKEKFNLLVRNLTKIFIF